jgi:DNA-binding transcriptional LysR family regulator
VIRPDLTTLRIFLAVYNLGNISKAAEREHLAPSAISRRIQALEAEIGAQLFYRDVRGVRATPAGEKLARHAITIFDNINDMAADLSAFAGGSIGQVRIHAHTSAVIQFLPDQLSSFKEQYPDVRIILREETSSEVIQSIVDGLADIGIVPAHMPMPESFDVLSYRHDRLVALVPIDHPLASKDTIDFNEIGDSSYIGLEAGSSLQILLTEGARSSGFTLNTRIEVKTFESAKRMVKAGLGIAVLPEDIVDDSRMDGRARRVYLSNDWAHREHVICVRDQRRLTASAELMLRHLRTPDTDQARIAMTELSQT